MGAISNRVFQNAIQYPEKLAIIEHGGKALTYSQLLKEVEKFVNFLNKEIDPAISRVAICMHEGINIPTLVLSLNALMVPIIPINPGLQSEQINTLIKSVDANVIIFDSSTSYLSKEIKNDVHVIDISIACKALITKKTELHDSSNFESYNEFLITLSSGSTGKPKPIVYSEKNKIDRSKQAIQLFNVTEEDVILCASPFFHSLGQRLTLLPLLIGSTLVQLNRFSAQNWCDAVSENKVTFTIPVSSHLHELVDIFFNSSKKLSSLRCLVSSSASIDYDIKKKLVNLLFCDFHEMYGTSEIATATDMDNTSLKTNSVGLPCQGVEIKILDKQMKKCESNQVGQIAVKSPFIFSGYYKLQALTIDSFHDDFFLTGDLGYLDEDSYLYFVDRIKDIIITGGMNIYPSDIESVIIEHPNISSCIVIGINDSYLGEVPVCVLVCEGDTRLVEREVRSKLQSRLASNQRPMKYFFRNYFPLSASGKIDKIALRETLNSLNLDLTAKLRAFNK